jgi:hypothetical protein
MKGLLHGPSAARRAVLLVLMVLEYLGLLWLIAQLVATVILLVAGEQKPSRPL